MVQPCQSTFTDESLKGYIFIMLECSIITCITMNSNISIYRQLNPRLLIQARVGLSLLHWANMFNISLTLNIQRTKKMGRKVKG